MLRLWRGGEQHGQDDAGREIRKNNYYYVDKTSLIEDILRNQAKVMLFTKSRRFGKSLNMSMRQYYFEIGTDPTLFEALQIAERPDLCEMHMGRYPVVFVSLKGVDGLTYADARRMFCIIMQTEAGRPDGSRYRLVIPNKEVREVFVEQIQELQKIDLGYLIHGCPPASKLNS